MAQSCDPQNHAGSMADIDQSLRRYLPAELADQLGLADTTACLRGPLIQAFVHLAAARYTITTYLPLQLQQQLLQQQAESPWLRWVDGTLLFADLSGSTALAERLSTLGREGIELVTAFLNDIFELMIQIIRSYGGDLVSFGGDALLVFFSDDRHPRTATRAALSLQEALNGYVRSVPGVGEFPMHLHVGVESGPVAFVGVGRADAQYHTVLGAAVNGVAAAEGLAGPGEVVVGPQTWATLGQHNGATEVAPGFMRVSAMPAPQRPHEPLPDDPPLTEPPELAIPRLLADLDRISPYIPAQLLGRILANPEQPQLEADLRPVTALFAQVSGLEQLAERLPSAQAAWATHIYVDEMQRAVEQFGGVLNKLDVADEGMKLIAIFGAPVAYADHAERAARAALEMQRRFKLVVRQIARELPAAEAGERSAPQVRQRIGLNLGAVFAGNVGSVVRKEYTVMGDAVNVAARVMSKAVWGEVWCSEATAHAIGAHMICDPRGSMALKGKAAPLPLYRLLGARDASERLPSADDGPLVGRVQELAWLRAQLEAALGGDGRAVRLYGDAGVGKSRLLAALLEHVQPAGARLLRATSFSYTASIPYSAWAEWLKELCQIAAVDNAAVRVRKLSAQLAGLGPGMAEWLPVLGDLVRLDVPENRLTRGLDPQMRQTRRFELLEQLLLRAADSGPIVVLFEDLHWADPISLELWRRVAAGLEGRPILLIGVHRPAPALAQIADGAHELALKELSLEESGALVAALAGGVALPRQVHEQLVQRAAGNPLYLAELLRALMQKIHAADRGTGAETGPAQPAALQLAIDDLPDSLSGLLLERIDRLDAASRSTLRLASVIGQRVPFGVLQSIQRSDQHALLLQLAHLDEQQITLQERDRPEPVHIFRHALIQEVSYQSILYARRRELHGRIGEYLERRYAGDLDDYYGLLAHHYRHSDQRDKAILYLLRAGHAARDVFANEEAMQYYRWSLDALAGDDDDARAWETHDALGDVLATVGRYDEALAEHAAILAAPSATPGARLQAHRKRGSVLEKQGLYDLALDELGRASAIVPTGSPDISPLAVPLISADVALVRKRRGEYDLAIAACEAGLSAVRSDPRSRDDELIEARLQSELGGIYGMRGNYPLAQAHFERSLKARESVDDLPGIIYSHNNLGYLWQLQSEYERALEHYTVAEELARKINLRYMLVFAANNAAYALISLGAYAEAEARCAEALVLSQDMKDLHNIAQIQTTMGFILYLKGMYEQSLESYRAALQIHQQLGSAYHDANTLMNIAVTLNAQQCFDAAREMAQRALERAEELHASLLKVEALNALAEALIGLGQADAAGAHASEAARLGAEIGSKHDEGIARLLLGQLAVAQARPFAAEFEASIGLFEATKNRFELARTWAAYGAALLKTGNQTAGGAYLKQAWTTFDILGAAGEIRRLAPLIASIERSA